MSVQGSSAVAVDEAVLLGQLQDCLSWGLTPRQPVLSWGGGKECPGRRMLGALELKLQAVVSLLTWTLGNQTQVFWKSFEFSSLQSHLSSTAFALSFNHSQEFVELSSKALGRAPSPSATVAWGAALLSWWMDVWSSVCLSWWVDYKGTLASRRLPPLPGRATLSKILTSLDLGFLKQSCSSAVQRKAGTSRVQPALRLRTVPATPPAAITAALHQPRAALRADAEGTAAGLLLAVSEFYTRCDTQRLLCVLCQIP